MVSLYSKVTTSTFVISSNPTISLYLNGTENANTSISYGVESNFTATISTSTDYVSLYINGTEVVSLTVGKATLLKTLAAGLYKVTAATNVSGVSNVTYYEKINPATPTLLMKGTPNEAATSSCSDIQPVNYTYNDTPFRIDANITTLNNQLAANLYLNDKLVGATTTGIQRQNASAGTYGYVFNTTGNQNYTSASWNCGIYKGKEIFQWLTVISKAAPTLALTSTPSANYTQNGTSLVFHFSISTVNNQLPADFYINGSLKNSSITTSGIYNAGYLPNTFKGVFNTSGNQNYTSDSVSLAMQIAPILYLNGLKDSNATITYGTQSNFTAQISNDYVEIYVNGTRVEPLTKGSVSYLNVLAAGLYKVTAATNVSGVSNVTYYERINKAAPTLAITDKPGNFTYNGTKDNSSALITTINSQLSATLYVNGNKVSTT
ncbi:hypothetical protein M1558_00585, partial [Candidatus Parvarchaeota archaeon]|nr:hypothetical protein [Candidatus Parvarchaeota archaeon]